MQASVSRTKSRRPPVSSKKTTRGKSARAEPKVERPPIVSEVQSGRRNSSKRVLKDKCVKERSVRFRSTDEEYVFEVDNFSAFDVPKGSVIFQTILTEMKNNFESGIDDEEDDDVFDGVFTATVTQEKTEKKFPLKKSTSPEKSILKRRTSSRR